MFSINLERLDYVKYCCHWVAKCRIRVHTAKEVGELDYCSAAFCWKNRVQKGAFHLYFHNYRLAVVSTFACSDKLVE